MTALQLAPVDVGYLLARLDRLARIGPTAETIGIRQPFPRPDTSSKTPVLDECA